MINDILDLSKIEDGKFEVECICCSPRDILRNVQQLMQMQADSKGLILTTELDDEVPSTIYCDHIRLQQILINLVGNAIKFTESGSVNIVARSTRGSDEMLLAFDVIDTGIEIKPENLERVFQPFQQADNSMARKFGGTGLGLTISKRFAELLGGELTVCSELGSGSQFTLTIDPKISMVSEASDQAEAHSQGAQTTGIKAGDAGTDEKPLTGSSILLIEDGPDNQRLLSFLLRKAGAKVAVADNGQIGRDMALESLTEGSPYDLIVTDMQMPVMDGYTATRELRERGYDGPIIALTAHAMGGERQKCLDAGCDDFATKPVDRAKLISLISGWLNVGKSNKEWSARPADQVPAELLPEN